MKREEIIRFAVGCLKKKTRLMNKEQQGYIKGIEASIFTVKRMFQEGFISTETRTVVVNKLTQLAEEFKEDVDCNELSLQSLNFLSHQDILNIEAEMQRQKLSTKEEKQNEDEDNPSNYCPCNMCKSVRRQG